MARQAAPRGLGKHCHCCRQKRASSQLIPCGASQGDGGAKHGPWCHRCILTKLHKSVAFLESAAAAAKQGLWKCPRCDDVCPCNKCIQRRRKEGKQGKRPGPSSNSGSEQDQENHGDCSGSKGDGEDSGNDSLKPSASASLYVCEESDNASSPGHSGKAANPASRVDVGFMEYKVPEDEGEAETKGGASSWDGPGTASEDPPTCQPCGRSGVSREQTRSSWEVEASVHTGLTKSSVCGSPRPDPPEEDVSVPWGSEMSARRVEAHERTTMPKKATDQPGETSDSAARPACTEDQTRSLGRLFIQKIVDTVVEGEDVDANGDSKLARSNPFEKLSGGFRQPGGSSRRSYSEAADEDMAAEAHISPEPGTLTRSTSRGDEDCAGALDYAPQTPATLERGKISVDSLGQRHSPQFPLRKRARRKGVPSRGDAGIDIAGDPEGGRDRGVPGDPLLRIASPVKEPAPVCSPHASFESLERGRLHDEEEGVVNSSGTTDSKDQDWVIGSVQVFGRPFSLERRCLHVASPPACSGLASPEQQRQGREEAGAAFASPCSGREGSSSDRAEDLDHIAEQPHWKRPRSKRPNLTGLVPCKAPKVPTTAPAFSDDISYEPPSHSHSSASSGSEGTSRALRPWKVSGPDTGCRIQGLFRM